MNSLCVCVCRKMDPSDFSDVLDVAVDVNECKEIAGNTGGATGPFRHLYLENELYLVQIIN